MIKSFRLWNGKDGAVELVSIFFFKRRWCYNFMIIETRLKQRRWRPDSEATIGDGANEIGLIFARSEWVQFNVETSECFLFINDFTASGKTDYHCKMKQTLFIQELNPTLYTNLTSDKLSPYQYITLTLVKPRSLAISKSNRRLWKCMLQHTKLQVKLFEMQCFTKFISSLCVISFL